MSIDLDSDSDINSDINLEDEDDDENSSDNVIPLRACKRTRYYDPEKKREHHNALERQRRCHIKESFCALKDSVPWLKGEVGKSKASRAQILKSAATYILNLNEKRRDNKKKIDDFIEENLRIEKEIKRLEEEKASRVEARTTSDLNDERKISEDDFLNDTKTNFCNITNFNESYENVASSSKILSDTDSLTANELPNYKNENTVSDDTGLNNSTEESDDFNSLWNNYSDILPGLSTSDLSADEDTLLNDLYRIDPDLVDNVFEFIPIKEESISFTDVNFSDFEIEDSTLPKSKRLRK